MKDTFLPGEQWLYLKIYMGKKFSDKLLIEQIFPFIAQEMENKLIDQFFFLRYADPDEHLRIRMETNKYCDVLSQILSILSKTKRQYSIYKVQIDTYQREVFRYEKLGVNVAEQLFSIDSSTILSFLFHPENLKYKWIFACLIFKNWMNIFKLNIDEQLEFVKTLADAYKKEYGIVSHLDKKPFDLKYREIGDALQSAYIEKQFPSEWEALLKRHYSSIVKVIPIQQNKIPYEEIGSYIHMSFNRLFYSAPRDHELALYIYLEKLLKTLKFKYKNYETTNTHSL